MIKTDSARDNIIYLSDRAIAASERAARDEDSRAVSEAVKETASSLKARSLSGPTGSKITLSYASALVRVMRLAADVAGDAGDELRDIANQMSRAMTRVDSELEARLKSLSSSGADMRYRMS